jgi:hypothetical protein
VMKLGKPVRMCDEGGRGRRGRGRGRAEDGMRSTSRTLVVCGLEGTRRLIQVGTAILRL